MSPYSALGLLLLFKQRRLPMTQSTFDEAVGVLIEVLEEVHNEQHRLDRTKEEK